MAQYIVKTLKTYLKSPLTASATSLVVRKFVDSKGNEVSLSDFGAWFVVVVKQGDTIEMIKCDGITQNGSDTSATLAVATNGRNLNPTTPYTGSASGNAFQSGAEVIVTNDPLTVMQFGNLNNAQTWALLQTFTLAPVSNADAVASNELVRKSQLDSAVLGSLTNAPVVVPANGGETLAVDQLVYLKVSDQEWYKADADTAGTVENIILGITRGAGIDGGAITNGVTILGEHVAGSAIFTAGDVFASNTAGGFATSAGTKEVSLGVAYSTTKIYFKPRYSQQITEDQQDALAGNSGTPSASNKFGTENDTANGATITGTTISFDQSSGEIRDSGNGFVTAGFRAGATVTVSGSSSNDGDYTIVSVAVGVLVVAEAVVDESASASITILNSLANKVIRADASGALPAMSAENLTNIKGANDSMTAGATIAGATLPVPVYRKSSDGEVYVCDGNDQTTLDFLGFATSSSTDGNPITVQLNGIVSGFSGLTAGSRYYVSDTAGVLSTTRGTYEVYVGRAISATEILIDSKDEQYIGSQSISVGGLTVPTDIQGLWNKIIVSGEGNGGASQGEVTLYRIGKTSGTNSVYQAGAPNFALGFSASISGTTLTISAEGNSTTVSGTAYYFR